MADGFVGKIYFERGDAASPEVFDRICTVFDIAGIGETNSLIDATTTCSTAMEYLSGLPEGAEFTIDANLVQADTDQAAMRADVRTGTARNYQIVMEQVSPALTFSFAAIPLAWDFTQALNDKNTGKFTFKITGPITEA